MYVSKIKTPYRTYRKARICQGDIFQDLFVSIGGAGGVYDEFHLTHSVVLTQDCDLDQDFTERKAKSNKNDKHIDTVLICPAYPIDSFSAGTHIKNRTMSPYVKGALEKIKRNDELKRYHYLLEDLDNGVPDLVIDFKHFFTIPRDVLYKQKNISYVTSVNEIYREALSQRFSNYLGRIGLPDQSSP
ncbi:MAG: hypothetical protein PWQ10_200 [Patescibacteria group bacterium]|nr:hypothetical protein [Patescibacteria group bacterium]